MKTGEQTDQNFLPSFLKHEAPKLIQGLLFEADTDTTPLQTQEKAITETIDAIVGVLDEFFEQWESLDFRHHVGLEPFKAIEESCRTVTESLSEIPSEYLAPLLPSDMKLTFQGPVDVSGETRLEIFNSEEIVQHVVIALQHSVSRYIDKNRSGGGAGAASHHARDLTYLGVLQAIKARARRNFWVKRGRTDAWFVFELARFCHRLGEAAGFRLSPLLPSEYTLSEIEDIVDLPETPTPFVRKIREIGQQVWAADNPPSITRGVSNNER